MAVAAQLPTVPGGLQGLRGRRGVRSLELDPVPESSFKGGEGTRVSREILRIAPPTRFGDLYEMRDRLHQAGQCTVLNATCKATGQEVIVKRRDKRVVPGGEAVWRALLQRMLNIDAHCHVLGVQSIYEDDQEFFMVMERCSGGELFDFLQTETDVPERECKRIMREILEAVEHIHSQGLIHRDIKPENIMFHDLSNDAQTPVSKRSPKTIKLIDFDTCQQFDDRCESPKAKHVVGTMGYIAPEALKGVYSPSSDLWSVGVILYILMTGDMPFGPEVFDSDPVDLRCGSHSVQSLYETLRDYTVDWECDPWPSFPQARELCQQLLAFDPGERSPSARAALAHPWLQGP